MSSKANNNNNILKRFTRLAESNLIIIMVLLILALWVLDDKFLSFTNVTNLLRQTAIIGVLAVGMTFVILSSGIDLSVGSVLAFSSILASQLMVAGYPIWAAILIALLAGSAIGALMGIVIHKGKVPAFIATLGGMTIVRGLVMLMCNARKIGGLPQAVGDFAVQRYLGIPAMAYVWFIAVIVGWFVSKYTVFGRNIYAIGSNAEAARLSGIKIGINICAIYAFSALMSSVAGILMTARLGNGVPTAGQGYELDAIAAVVVGGGSLMGAVGSIPGTVLGTIIIATIRNGGTLLGINPFILDILVGSLIVVAVLFDQLRKNKSK
ncbi:MAG: ABC transporter permease [Clostridiales bacterium]|nr:ABC transporter permease [Clostridiales bacterium]